MAIDFEKEVAEHPHLHYEVHQRWDIDGHEVALATGHWTEDDGSTRKLDMLLLCDCDFTQEDRIIGGENDPESCSAKASVREEVLHETWERYGSVWKDMGLKDAIMDVFSRNESGEYLGSHNAGHLYTQDVADILQADHGRILTLCDELRQEERLDLHGRILAEYEQHLRFPEELAQMLRYMIEEPLGWPNGEAGDGFVYNLAGAIEEKAGISHGKELFGEENFPNIAPRHLLVFGTMWLLDAAKAAEEGAEGVMVHGTFTGEPDRIRGFASRLRGLAALAGGEKDDKSCADTGTLNEKTVATHEESPDFRFTFPEELRELLIVLNRDTGVSEEEASSTVRAIEQVLSFIEDFPDSPDAFWEHNHPRVSPHILRMYGLMWIEAAIARAEADTDVRDKLLSVRTDAIAHTLCELAERIETLD